MPKESLLVLKICDWVVKYSIYAAIFLVPVFFLPWTADVLDFNKQTIVLLLVFVALFCWMTRVLVSGKFELNISPMHIVVGVLFLTYLLSVVFSTNSYGSFWGWPQIPSESLLSLIAFVLLYFLVSNVFSKRNIFVSLIILSFSILLAELIGLLQLFGLFILPFSFAKTVAFNTLGSVGSLGFIAAIMLPLAIVMLIRAKKWWKLLFILEIVFSALILFLVNYPIVWWATIAGSALIMIFGIMKRDVFDGRWMDLPMFFLAVSLFFVLLNPQINLLSQKPNEIFLSQRANLDISLQTLKERPILGSGPGTFTYDFLKYKSPDFSKSSLWNFAFNRGASKVLNDLVTTGILGFLALLALLAFPVFYGVKFLIAEKEANSLYWVLALGLSACLVAQGLTYFLYNSNIVLDFVYFFLIASLIGLTAKEKKVYELKPSSLITLLITFVFTLVFIFGLGLVILDGQRYIAEMSYLKGLVKYQAGQKDEGIKSIEAAASANSSSDLYFRQLSQAYLAKLQDELQNSASAPSDEETKKIQTLVANSINAAKIATDLNPNNANNWSVRGYVYQSLFGVISDAGTWAEKSYDEALKLSPNDPYLSAQKGNVFLAMALKSPQDQAQQKSQYFEQAQEQLEKAVNLNPNYSNALYSLGLVYDSMGQKDKAIESFSRLLNLNPGNQDVQKILSNLRAGKSALEGLNQQQPQPENPPETLPLKK